MIHTHRILYNLIFPPKDVTDTSTSCSVLLSQACVFVAKGVFSCVFGWGYSSTVRYGLIKVDMHTTSIVKLCCTCSTLDHSNAAHDCKLNLYVRLVEIS